jgi:hypothetical protein
MPTVSKSLKECAAYNAANKEAIDLGVMEQWQPDECTLQREKLRAEVWVEHAADAAAATGILNRVLAALADGIGQDYQVSVRHADPSNRMPSLTLKDGHGPRVEFDYFIGPNYNYWRVDVHHGYKDHKYVKLGEMVANVERVEKIAAALKEKHEQSIRQKQASTERHNWCLAKEAAENAGQALFKADPDTFKPFNLDGIDDISAVDGVVTAQVTLRLTHEQWKQLAQFVVDAKAEPAADGKAVAA